MYSRMASSSTASKGETIIEVLFAVVIFSALAISALSVMNKGVGTAQRSLEITLVRQEMNTQAELLRFIHDSYINGGDKTPWETVAASENVITASQLRTLDEIAQDCVPPGVGAKFVINPRTLAIVRSGGGGSLFKGAEVYPRINYGSANLITDVEGVWVQQLRGNNGGTDFRDFHIRACWNAPGSAAPVTLSTLVRLYVPS